MDFKLVGNKLHVGFIVFHFTNDTFGIQYKKGKQTTYAAIEYWEKQTYSECGKIVAYSDSFGLFISNPIDD